MLSVIFIRTWNEWYGTNECKYNITKKYNYFLKCVVKETPNRDNSPQKIYLGSKDSLNSTGSLAGTKDILRDAFNADSRLPQLIIPR